MQPASHMLLTMEDLFAPTTRFRDFYCAARERDNDDGDGDDDDDDGFIFDDDTDRKLTVSSSSSGTHHGIFSRRYLSSLWIYTQLYCAGG
jgi:hypothetical protein